MVAESFLTWKSLSISSVRAPVAATIREARLAPTVVFPSLGTEETTPMTLAP